MVPVQTIEQLRQQKQAKQEELAEIEKQISQKLSQTIVRCPNKDCHRGYEIRELNYIQTQWYVEPYSCTGGDYWKDGEGQWECPVCRTVTRLYDQPEITALKKHFKGVVTKRER